MREYPLWGQNWTIGVFFARHKAIYRVLLRVLCDTKAGRWVNRCYYPALKMTVVDSLFFWRVSFMLSHPCGKKPRHGWGTRFYGQGGLGFVPVHPSVLSLK